MSSDICQKAEKADVLTSDSKKKTTVLAAKNETAESTTRQTQVLLTAQLPMSTSML